LTLDDELSFDVVQNAMFIRELLYQTMQTSQLIMQCALVADELVEIDDVLDEMRQLLVVEIDETLKTVAIELHQHQLIDVMVETVLNEILAQEITDSAEVVVDDDEFDCEMVETVDTVLLEARVILTQWTVETLELVEMVESGEDDETVDEMVVDTLLEHLEDDETDILVEMLDSETVDVIVCLLEMQFDEMESFKVEKVQTIDVHSLTDEIDDVR